VWGCPIGGRATVESLPQIIDYADEAGQTAFLDAYIRHRAVNYPNKATSRLHGTQLLAFHQAVADLIVQVTGEHASAGDRGVTVSAAAMRALDLAES
jgi:hypothetical protein